MQNRNYSLQPKIVSFNSLNHLNNWISVNRLADVGEEITQNSDNCSPKLQKTKLSIGFSLREVEIRIKVDQHLHEHGVILLWQMNYDPNNFLLP